jgi:hypothetical protein
MPLSLRDGLSYRQVLKMKLKALFTGLEQLIAFSMLFIAILSVIALILHYYNTYSLNSSFFAKKTAGYALVQQISYDAATNNHFDISPSTNQEVRLYNISDSAINRTCNLAYAEAKNYVCGIITYDGMVYVIRVYQNV